MPAAKTPFLDSIIRFMRVRSYSKRSIDTYLYWIRYFGVPGQYTYLFQTTIRA